MLLPIIVNLSSPFIRTPDASNSALALSCSAENSLPPVPPIPKKPWSLIFSPIAFPAKIKPPIPAAMARVANPAGDSKNPTIAMPSLAIIPAMGKIRDGKSASPPLSARNTPPTTPSATRTLFLIFSNSSLSPDKNAAMALIPLSDNQPTKSILKKSIILDRIPFA